MANSISRTYTFQDGTTAFGSQVESEIANIVSTINNADAGTSKWTVLSAFNATSTPLISDNSSGTNNIFEARNNGTAVLTVANGGVTTFAPGGTTKVVINSSSVTLSNSETLAMGAAKITGLANGTATTDAAAFGQVKVVQVVENHGATSTSITSSSFADTVVTATLTPSSASNKLKITVSFISSIPTAAGTAQFTLKAAGSQITGGAGMWSQSNVGSATGNFPSSYCYLHSPATTSAVAVVVQALNANAAGTISVGNGYVWSIVLEEVAP